MKKMTLLLVLAISTMAQGQVKKAAEIESPWFQFKTDLINFVDAAHVHRQECKDQAKVMGGFSFSETPSQDQLNKIITMTEGYQGTPDDTSKAMDLFRSYDGPLSEADASWAADRILDSTQCLNGSVEKFFKSAAASISSHGDAEQQKKFTQKLMAIVKNEMAHTNLMAQYTLTVSFVRQLARNELIDNGNWEYIEGQKDVVKKITRESNDKFEPLMKTQKKAAFFKQLQAEITGARKLQQDFKLPKP